MSLESFENVNYKNLFAIYGLVKDGNKSISDVKLNYSRYNKYLQENLNFLIELGVLKIQNEKLYLKNNKEEDFKEILINSLVDKNSFFVLVKEYLQNFIADEKEIHSFEPDTNYNFKTSDLRNFLISANFIKNDQNKYYVVEKKILELFRNKKISPEELKKIINAKEKIGLAAEEIVLQEETKKVQKINKNLIVDHVALKDVSAGYDILSFNQKQEKIFIEVKAVSSSNFKFYLSSNEYNTAKIYNKKYFLYLLPIDLTNPQKFNYNNILMINDINNKIFNNEKEWVVENENYSIFKKN